MRSSSVQEDSPCRLLLGLHPGRPDLLHTGYSMSGLRLSRTPSHRRRTASLDRYRCLPRRQHRRGILQHLLACTFPARKQYTAWRRQSLRPRSRPRTPSKSSEQPRSSDLCRIGCILWRDRCPSPQSLPRSPGIRLIPAPCATQSGRAGLGETRKSNFGPRLALLRKIPGWLPYQLPWLFRCTLQPLLYRRYQTQRTSRHLDHTASPDFRPRHGNRRGNACTQLPQKASRSPLHTSHTAWMDQCQCQPFLRDMGGMTSGLSRCMFRWCSPRMEY